MTLKALSREANKRLLDCALGSTPLPLKILEQKQRYKAVLAAADRQYRPQDTTDSDQMMCLLGMHHGIDALYLDWAEGTERIRWVDIPERDDITPEIVVRECVMSTESFFGNMGVEVLAAYLDTCDQGHLLYKLGRECALYAREYLTIHAPSIVYSLYVLNNPSEHFGTTDQDILRQKLTEHFIVWVNTNSPQHVIQAMITNIEWGLGNAVQAIESAGFAYCEATVDQFGQKLQAGHPDAQKAFLDWELWKAKRLLELLR